MRKFSSMKFLPLFYYFLFDILLSSLKMKSLCLNFNFETIFKLQMTVKKTLCKKVLIFANKITLAGL